MIRLQKILAQAGVASRRAAEEMILAGRVRVNGKVITELGTKADPSEDRIEVDGKPITAVEKKVYYVLNKPVGYVSTMKDPQGRPSLADLTSGVKERVFPVGRLDYDTSGILIVTNDGELAHLLAHPKKEIDKFYKAKVRGVPTEKELEKLRKGILLDDGITAPARVRILSIHKNNAWLEIIIHEGRNRQVRRMCEAVGYPVLKLKRVRIGTLEAGELKPGELRRLTDKEIDKLKILTGLEWRC